MDNDYYKNITLQQLEALICLVDAGNFSRAAQKMGITQPALTNNIRNIEDYAGTKIVNRSKTGISLTPAGMILYNYARRISKLRNETREKILQQAANTGGDIYIGASSIPGTYILPRTLGAFQKKHPAIRIHVQTADSMEAINMVLDKQVEIGLVGKKPVNNKLVAQKLWDDKLVLAAGKAHPWYNKKSVTMEQLAAEPFVLREKGSATREALELFLKEENLIGLSQFNICAELGSSEAIKEAVLSGCGVSIISIRAIERELAQGLIFKIPLSGCNIERDFYLIYQRQMEITDSRKMFINFLKAIK